MSKQVFTGQDDLANHLKLHLGGGDRNLDLNPLLTEIRWALTLGFTNNVLFFIGPAQSGKTKLISTLSLASVDNYKEKITSNNNGSENSVVTLTSAGGSGGDGGGLALVDTVGFLEDNIDSFHQIRRDFEFCRPNAVFTVLRSSDLKEKSSRAKDTLKISKLICNDNNVKCDSTSFVSMKPSIVKTTTRNEIIITHMHEYDSEFFDKFKEMIHKFQFEYIESELRKEFEKIGEKEKEVTRERVKETQLTEAINHLQNTTISPKKGFFSIFSSNCDLPSEGQRESDLRGKLTKLSTVTSNLEIELRSLKEISIKNDPQWMDKSYNYAISKYVEYLSQQDDPLPSRQVSIENDLIKKVKSYAVGGELTEIKFEDLILQVFKEHFQSNVHFQSMLNECGWSYADTKIHFIFNNLNSFYNSHNDNNWGVDSMLNSIKQSNSINPYQRKVQLAQAITGHFCKLILDHWQIINTCEVLPHHVIASGVSNNDDIPFIVYLLVKTLSIIETTNDPTRSYLEAINKLKSQKQQQIGNIIESCKMMNWWLCFNFQYYHLELCKDVKSVAEWATKFYMGSDEEEMTITTTAATNDESVTTTTANRRARSYDEEDCSSQMKKQKQ